MATLSEPLKIAIERPWSRQTSFNPDRWSKSNPAYGQCAVTALVVQDFLGGRLKRTVAPGEETVSHYYNELPDGKIMDLTLRQFQKDTKFIEPEYREREYVLSYPPTAAKYQILKQRVLKELSKLQDKK
jgi:hypothetical protein